MIVTTKAIVITSVKFSEADLIVSCFTEEAGLKSYMLRGILKSKKGKLKASYFFPLTQLEIVAQHKNKGTLERIREVKVTTPYNTLHTDVVKGSLVLFISEILKNAIQEEEVNKEIYQFLESAFLWLDTNTGYSNFHLLFLVELSAYLGFYPDTSNLQGAYFNLQEGSFQTTDNGFYCETGNGVATLKKILGLGFDTVASLKLTKKQRSESLNLLLAYYQLHLQGFKKPKSLEVLNQLFST